MPPSRVFASTELLEPTHQAITKAVDFLLQAQQPDGSFRSAFCFDHALHECVQTSATIPTALVLAGVSAVDDPRVAALVERGVQFLLVQMDAEGFFGYLSRTDPGYTPHPGEVGVTCAIHTVLETIGVSLPPILPRLATAQRPDGTFPFYAVSQSEHEQFRKRYGPAMRERFAVVHPVANTIAFHYLTRHGQAPEGLCRYLGRLATREPAPEAPVFVDNPYVFCAALSWAYSDGAACLEPVKAILQPRLLQQQRPDGSWRGHAIDTALAVNSLIHFGYTGDALDRAVSFLLGQQQADGSWTQVVAFVPPDSNPVWRVSDELSTGYVLGWALGPYLKARGVSTL